MVAEAPRFRPSPLTVLLAGWVVVSMPDRPSVPVQATDTSLRYHSPPFESPVGAPVREGTVLSMLILSTVTEPLFPATSWLSPWTDWLPPSLAMVWSGPQPTIPLMPESVSVQRNVTLTSVLFQPNELAAGVRSPLMVGAIVSTFTSVVLTLSFASSLPAMSTLQKVMVWTPVDKSAVKGSPYVWVAPPSIV